MPQMPRAHPPLWLPLPGHRLLKGRAGHTATLVGKKILILGGRNGNEFFNDLWEFDIQVNQWKQLQRHTSFSARAYHTATLIQDNWLWVIGGSDHLTMYGDVHVLKIDTLEWTSPVTKGHLAGKLRGTHAAIQHPIQLKGILVFGGYGGLNSQWLHDMAILQTDTLVWEVLQPNGVRPSGRGYHTLTAFGIHVVLFGGKGDTGIIPSDQISVYDAKVNMWISPRLKGMTPTSRSNHAAVLVKDNLIVIHGGRNGSERLSDLWLLQILSPPSAGHVDSFAWHVIEQEKPKVKKGKAVKSQVPGGRSAHTLIAEDMSLYLFGGYGGGGVTFDDIFVIHCFPETAAVKSTMAGIGSRTARRTSAVGSRLEADTDDVEGWRSTKQPRRFSHSVANVVHAPRLHILDSDENTGENTSTGVPVPVEDMEDVDRPIPTTSPMNSRPQISRVEQLQTARVEALLNLQDETHAKITLEKGLHEKELACLQQVVDSLKAEVNGLKAEVSRKNMLELELRAGKAGIEHNFQLLQKQVEEDSQKILLQRSEIDRLKFESRGLFVKVEEREREIREKMQKLQSSEQNLEELSRSLEQMKVMYLEASHKLESSVVRVQDLQRDLEKQTREAKQMQQTFEKERVVLNKNIEERNDTTERLSKELEDSKDVTRTLQETLERLSKHIERDNVKIESLEKEKEKLMFANTTLAAEQAQLIGARDGAEATLELVREEVRVARSVIERNAVEIGRMRENTEHAKEHICSLHASVKKNEEELKSRFEENEKLRLLIKETEDFENAQVRSVLSHVEKLRCARQFGPHS